MNKNLSLLLGIGIGIAATGLLLIATAFNPHDSNNDLLEVKRDGRLQYKWYAPPLPQHISFAGEAVPLQRWEVRERLDREFLSNFYQHAGTLYILKLASRYFPTIEARLKANGIPDDFKYLCVAESALQHRGSSAGAESFWQFIPATAREYGLEVDSGVDQRFDLVQSTDAACKYFQKAYEKFGSWTAAAASYNCGLAGYASQADFQGSRDYYALIFPEETNRYIFRILALKYLLSSAHELGFILQPQDRYQPIAQRSITVTESIPNLAEWVQAQGSTYKYLKLLNPWLRARSLSVPEGKSYEIALPL